ncbi:hypothetical protein [Heliorestis convoluta]|uniref:Peptidase MA-like domain-containing protein n=1 Tax=Heliorestis convoluta TaxID=356322 RepID=A0A5Q2N8W6_9FIRM|nr:hypothetical protein [Heliorestis convoluta]QGG48935.1 hypothetical protein FTV88_2846 [Heliorestis convoluta]
MGAKFNMGYYLIAAPVAYRALIHFWRYHVGTQTGFSLIRPIIQLQQKSYHLYRNYKIKQALGETKDWHHLEGESVILRYKRGQQQEAEVLLEKTESIYNKVVRHMNCRPEQKAIVLFYQDRHSFNQVFGWNDESALGVYYAGVVRLLSPRLWDPSAKGTVESKESVAVAGPMAHELAHLILDYRTKGNVQRWFTEAVAQNIERVVTGYTLQDPAPGWSQRLYPWEEMDRRFDSLPDQKLAYRQSLLAYDTLVEAQSDAMPLIWEELAQGKKIEQALYLATGLTWADFTEQVKQKAYEAEKKG